MGRRRSEVQTLRDKRGAVIGYRKQVNHPVTGKRFSLTGRSAGEVLGRWERLRAKIRDHASGLASDEELSEEVALVRSRPSSLTVAELWREYVRHVALVARESETASSWARKLEGMGRIYVLGSLGQLSAAECNYDTMVAWAERVSTARRGMRPISRRHLANVFFAVRACFRLAIKMGKLSKLPWGAFTVVHSRRGKEVGAERGATVTGDELARMLEVTGRIDALVMQSYPTRLPDLTARVGVMTLLALRRGEGAALAWDQVRVMPSGAVQVFIKYQAREGWARRGMKGRDIARPMAAPKARSARPLTLSPNLPAARLLMMQKRLLESRGLYRPDGPVFPDAYGAFRTRDVVRSEQVRRIALAAGLAGAGRWVQHSFRHSGITLHLVGGASPKEVQALAGHARLETLEGYIHRARGAASADAAASELQRVLRLDAPGSPLESLPSPTALHQLEGAAPSGGLLPSPSPRAPSDSPEPLPVIVRSAEGEVIIAGDVTRTGLDAARSYHERHLGRSVVDFKAAFREWLSMGAPLPETGVEARQAAPRSVREGADRAADRARQAAAKNFAEGWREGPVRDDKLRAQRAAAESARRRTINAWAGWRDRYAREARARGEALPAHVLAHLDRKAGRLPAEKRRRASAGRPGPSRSGVRLPPRPSSSGAPSSPA